MVSDTGNCCCNYHAEPLFDLPCQGSIARQLGLAGIHTLARHLTTQDGRRPCLGEDYSSRPLRLLKQLSATWSAVWLYWSGGKILRQFQGIVALGAALWMRLSLTQLRTRLPRCTDWSLHILTTSTASDGGDGWCYIGLNGRGPVRDASDAAVRSLQYTTLSILLRATCDRRCVASSMYLGSATIT